MKNKSLSFFFLATFLLANFATSAFSGFSFNNPETHAEHFFQNIQNHIGQNSSAILDHIGDFRLANHQSRSDHFLTPNSGTTKITKPDFYVAPDGTTIQSTGYRYMDSTSPYTPTSTNPTGRLSYFGLDDFSTGADARSAYQILYNPNKSVGFTSWSDARVQGTFDTLQLFDTKGKSLFGVPYANGGTSSVLETFTSSYPSYGKGGYQQFIPLDPTFEVNFSNIKLLPEGISGPYPLGLPSPK